jgi:hypothetical protein
MSDPLAAALWAACRTALDLLPEPDRLRLLEALAAGGRVTLDRTAVGWVRLSVVGYGVVATIDPASLLPPRMLT